MPGIDAMRNLFLAALVLTATFAQAAPPMPPELARTTWHWVGFTTPVETLTITEPESYVTGAIHRRTSHPAPRCVRLVSALLINSDRSGSHIAQFKPAQPRHAARAYAISADDGFVVAEIPISQAKHQTIPNAIQII